MSSHPGAINWFAPYLLQIAALAARPDSHLDLRIRIFVTCLCDPAAVPKIPGCAATQAHPSVSQVLDRFLDPLPAKGADRHTSFEVCSPRVLCERVRRHVPSVDFRLSLHQRHLVTSGRGVPETITSFKRNCCHYNPRHL
ncbi:hypothetical protein B0H19DRAFT_1257462 [Mycena capillaripes]|nr:hypothetical protein B0H19DRAFT_1257462 [Mycena capillaripes]